MPDTQEITPKTPVEIMKKILHFYPLPSLTLLTFSSLKKGSEEEQTAWIKHFLQGQLTCDLDEVSEGQSRWFAHCNLQGRMISLGRLVQIKDSYFLILPKNIAQTAQQHLEKYAAFSRISIEEKANFQCFGLNSETPIENYPTTQNTVLTQDPLTLISLGEQRWLGLSREIPNLSDEFDLIPHDETEWLTQEIQHLSPFLTPETVGEISPA